MATKTGGVNNDPEDLFRAVLNELNRVIGDDPTGWTVTKRLPAVVQASQLSVYGLLILKGTNKAHADVYPHRAKLDTLLDKVLQKSKSVWAEGLTKKPSSRQRYLEDVKPIRPAVRAVVKFAEKNIGLNGERLGDFGVDDVQDAIALLVGRISKAMEMKLAAATKAGGGEQVPEAVHAAAGLGMLAGGLSGRREMVPKEVSAARVLARMGSEKDERSDPEPKRVKRLRKTLKGLAAHLPEQRG
jgi:hypothetical protein